MKLRIDLISMWEAGMIFQGSSGAVGQPAGPDALRRGRRPGSASWNAIHRAECASRPLRLLAAQPHLRSAGDGKWSIPRRHGVLQADGMVLDGTSPEALQFGSGPSRPWRANENSQVALAGVVPAVV